MLADYNFSRFLTVFRRFRNSKGVTVQELIAQAIAETGMEEVPHHERVQLVSDNGACYKWGALNSYLKSLGIRHIFSMRNHPQTNGKVERLNRTAKEKLQLIVHASPEAFDRALEAFRHWYNYEHNHKGIDNLHPADVYHGRAETILRRRKRLQTQTKKTRRQVNTSTSPKLLKLRNLHTQTTP